jgi:hypothetical protein
LNIGFWAGFSPVGGESNIYVWDAYAGPYTPYPVYVGRYERDGIPPAGFGLELDFRPFEHWGFKASFMGTVMRQSRSVLYYNYGSITNDIPNTAMGYFNQPAWGLMFTLAPEFLFKWLDRDFGIWFGLAAYVDTVHYDYGLYVTNWSEEYKDTALGMNWGMEGEIVKIGPGDLFVTINADCIFGTSKHDPETVTTSPLYWNPHGRLQLAGALNIGIGYRFGFIAKKAQ